jgi:hypothetical protein
LSTQITTAYASSFDVDPPTINMIPTIKNTIPILRAAVVYWHCSSARIALSKETEERKEEIWRRIAEAAVRNYEVGNGLVRIDNESICVVGTRP